MSQYLVTGVEAPEAESTSGSDENSDYGSYAESSYTATSSIFEYQYENGRRYHAFRAGQYLLPNDDDEQERLDMTHHVFRLALDGELCATKLDDPMRILDVGTGTGLWAVEMGDLFPKTEIVGTDLSPIQPSWVPPNVSFYVEDATGEWSFAPDDFDFIHARTLAGSILDWPSFLQRCMFHLRPGGKLEIAEGRANFWYARNSVPSDSYTHQWLSEWRRLSSMLHFDVFPELSGFAEKCSFKNVKTKEVVVPLGLWPKDPKLKEIGRWFKAQFLESALEAYTLALFTRNGGWKEVEVKTLIAHVKEEIEQGRMQLYTFCSFLTAEKPK
ncbi:Hypothetical protein R9X50_00421300 [Acrodontium crateriforme]|uniref:S-adenosyl-L-methionine-dependent methyltransferase n=1 Tax=Acrodontium crateriforme TaxID=150365 RepID=A0AAQ3M5R5_9PEZI|nr:Hypothetical protein R9X50_00421300 [Acrodontium crateriforme]